MEKIGWLLVLSSIISLFVSKESILSQSNQNGDNQEIERILLIIASLPWYFKLLCLLIGGYIVKRTKSKNVQPISENNEFDFSDLTVAELRKECKTRGINVSGNKKELIERIKQFDLEN